MRGILHKIKYFKEGIWAPKATLHVISSLLRPRDNCSRYIIVVQIIRMWTVQLTENKRRGNNFGKRLNIGTFRSVCEKKGHGKQKNNQLPSARRRKTKRQLAKSGCILSVGYIRSHRMLEALLHY